MVGNAFRVSGRVLFRTVGTAVLANILFLVLIVAAPINPDRVAGRIRTAFETGELGLADYLPFDSRRGWHQYNDCMVLQMLSNKDTSRMHSALAPVVYGTDEEMNGSCAVLHALVMEEVDRETLHISRYARYWHGYKVLAAFALRVMDVKDFRCVLTLSVWLAIVVLGIVSIRSRPNARLAGMTISLSAATVWAVPYFSPSLTHGPGDAVLLLSLAGIAAWPRLTSSLGALLPYAAGFGAIVVFFEMLTGQLPLAAAWMVAMTLAAGRDTGELQGKRPLAVTLGGVAAFGFGAVVTVVAKQLLALPLAEAMVGEQFLSHLHFYMGVPASVEGWPGILVPFGRLVRKSYVLTFGNKFAGYVLIAVSVLTWMAVAIRGWRQRRGQYGLDVTILIAAALIPMVWVFLLPRHTYIHAAFMVRMLVAPISLGLIALCWPYAAARTSR